MEIAQDASPLVGRLLDDRYRLDRLIARGGMATVYLGTDTRLDRAVAVKVMHAALADDPEFVARFAREARAAAAVSTAEVVAVHDQATDRHSGLSYLVMEYVQGVTLRQLLAEHGALSPARAVSLMEPVLRALAAAHHVGLVHRDVKPENVLLGDDGRVKVADFGLARAIESSTLTQTTGLLIGTVAYLAPEQVERGTADARSDVYAAGVMLWELLTGTPPYAGDKPLSVAYRHVHEDIPPPSTVVDGIEPDLDALVVRATRRDPAARPADAGEFLAALLALRPGLATTSPVTAAAVAHDTLVVPRAAEPPPPPRERHRGRLAIIGLLTLALLALAGGYYLGSYRYTSAPSVLRLNLASATRTLAKDGLHARRGPDRFSEQVPAGEVVAQSPAPHGRVAKSGTVTVFLSKGPDRRVVPTVAGDDIPTATTALTGVGLTVAGTVSQFSDTVPSGTVIGTNPPGGTRLAPSTGVQLLVSKGKQPVEVPNTTGEKKDQAVQQLQGLGFKVVVQQVFSDTVQVGDVVSQTPSAGVADKGSTVTLAVSKGPQIVTVPDVRGLDSTTARRMLESAGLVVNEQVVLSGGPGQVLRTDPKGGSRVHSGTTVTMWVY